MTSPSFARRLADFEACRRDLVGLAYRMLGDMGRAEDMVQEAWLRWSGTEVVPDSPKAYLTTVVTRLCLNELDSARARREESRGDRLPEPVEGEVEGARGHHDGDDAGGHPVEDAVALCGGVGRAHEGSFHARWTGWPAGS